MRKSRRQLHRILSCTLALMLAASSVSFSYADTGKTETVTEDASGNTEAAADSGSSESVKSQAKSLSSTGASADSAKEGSKSGDAEDELLLQSLADKSDASGDTDAQGSEQENSSNPAADQTDDYSSDTGAGSTDGQDSTTATEGTGTSGSDIGFSGSDISGSSSDGSIVSDSGSGDPEENTDSSSESTGDSSYSDGGDDVIVSPAAESVEDGTAGDKAADGLTDDDTLSSEDTTISDGTLVTDAALTEGEIPEGQTLPEEEVPAQPVETVEEAVLVDTEGLESEVDLSDIFTPDSDELLLQYFDKELFGSSVSSAAKPKLKASVRTRGSRLTGNNRLAYDALAEALKDISDGNRESSEITVTFELPEGYAADKKYYADDFGYEFYKDGNLDRDNYLSACDKLKKDVLGLDISKIVDSLYADYPYHFYWWGKNYVSSNPISCYTTSTGDAFLQFDNPPEITFRFTVDKSYAGNNASPCYTVNTDLTSAASVSAANAVEIVNEASSMTDYNKLVYYREKICELVEYNDDAARYGRSVVGGNPWQLIWVFDKDPSTNVVCEGYSKAFQYLCDLTESFDAAGIECISPTGKMDGGTGAGLHMWNIVSFKTNSGETETLTNYLVDVTNCDQGSAGYPDRLFLHGYTSGSVTEGYAFQTSSTKTILYTYDEDTLSLYTEDELKLSDTDYTAEGVVKVSAYTRSTESSASVADISISPVRSYYSVGETVNLEAKSVSGYDFLGWYDVETLQDGLVNEYGGTCLSPNLKYSFKVGGETKVVAVYKPVSADGRLYVKLENEARFQLNNNTEIYDISRFPENAYFSNIEFGRKMTLHAADPDRVLEWKNESDKVLGRSSSLDVIVVGVSKVKLTYTLDNTTESTSYVQFVSDYGQVLASGTYSRGDTPSWPDSVPTKTGYQFVKWVFDGTEEEEATAAAIRDRIGTDSTITIKPVYEQLAQTETENSYRVIVNYVAESASGTPVKDAKTVEGKAAGSKYTASAPSVSGYKFSHWEDGNGRLLGYSSSCFLQVTGDTVIYAVYVSESTSVQEAVPVMTLGAISKVNGTAGDGTGTVHKLSCAVTRDIPEGYTLIEHGMLYTNASADTSSLVNGGTGVRKYISTATMMNGVVRLNVRVSQDSITVAFRGYMILRNEATGNIETFYSDISSGSYNSVS